MDFNVGVGLQSDFKQIYSQIFVNIKLFFLYKNTSPFISLEGGKTFNLTHLKENYNFINLTLGMRIKQNIRVGLKYYILYKEVLTSVYPNKKEIKPVNSLGFTIALDLF